MTPSATPTSRRPSPFGSLTRQTIWIPYLTVGALFCLLYEFLPPLRGSRPVINGLGFWGVCGVVAGIRIHRPRHPLAWWLFAAGLLLFWAGDVYTYSFTTFGPTIRFPSIGDALYVAVYPVLMSGLLVLVRLRNKQADGPGLIDALIMSLGLALVSGVVLIAPFIHAGSLTLLQKLVSIAHPAGDIILLAAGVRLAVDAGKRRPAFYLLMGSIVALLITDFVYGVLESQGLYTHQLWVDAGWIFFYLLWGAAAMHPSMAELSDVAPARTNRLSLLRLLVLAGATLLAPVLEVIKVLPSRNWDLLGVVVASIILFGLVIGRIWGLVRAQDGWVRRERLLTKATGLLVAATAPWEIVISGLQAIAEIGSDEAQARLCRIAGDNIRVFSLTDGGGIDEWSTSDAVGALVGSTASGDTVTLPAHARRELRLSDRHARALALELRAGSENRGRLLLLVAGPAAEADDTRYSLRTLGHQVALALGSAELSEEVHRSEGEARFSTLVQNSSDLITVVSADNTILYQSPSIERVLGYDPDEVVGKSFELLLHPGEQGRLLRRLNDGAGAAGRPEAVECLLRHRDGSLRHFEILHTNLLADEAVGGIVLNGRDVSERKAFEEQLTHQAFHDPVTSLANRALFNERVRHAVARTVREGGTMAVLFVDLDDFKTVNDSLGHAAGDVVLQAVAKRISASIRAADTAARFGGDEFAVLLEDVGEVRVAAETAERILEELARPLEVEQTDIAVRASVGISVSDPENLSGAEEMIRNADAAMYIAKSDGKGGYRLFESTMHEQVVARLELRAALQQALDRQEFQLYFQPLVRLQDGVVTGFEALLRWMHPDRGMISPDQFIPFAEESGLIVPIGRWVLQEGCRQAVVFREAVEGDVKPKIGINLSVKQLFHADIVGDIASALEDSGLPPEALTLEITESVMMNDISLAVERLTQMRELGVRLAMDDFGTGYSSLSYLSRLPLDILKMDRSLLAAGASPTTSGLAAVVVGLGDTFQLEVVAEGIEFPEQSQTLRELGCETGQGFYFARPMASESLLAYLQERAVEPHTVTSRPRQ
jgi:diguanylate cyclase (GGDEF)-like protein/PAS domain S-box-containing protein